MTTAAKLKETNFRYVASLREASINETNRTIETCIIQEGLGNLGDLHFYTKEALKSAPPIFDGEKIYADHPSRSEETDRPERTTRDNLGYHSDVRYGESDLGRGMVYSTVKVLPGDSYDWAWQQMREAVAYAKKYSNKSFVGVSINANGDSTEVDIDDFLESYQFPSDPAVRAKVEEAKAAGKQHIFVVSNITEAVSADMVTEAGAGGKFVKLKESNRGGSTMKKWLESLLKTAKGGSVGLAESDIKAKIKEAEEEEAEEEEAEEEEAADATGAGEPDGDEQPDIHIHTGEDENAMMATYGRYVKQGGLMKHNEWKKEYERMKASEKKESEQDEGEEKKKESNRAVTKIAAENAILREKVKKLELKDAIKDALYEAGFPGPIEKKIRPLLERAKDESEIKEIVEDWASTLKEADEDRASVGPGKGSSLRESNNNDLFAGVNR